MTNPTHSQDQDLRTALVSRIAEARRYADREGFELSTVCLSHDATRMVLTSLMAAPPRPVDAERVGSHELSEALDIIRGLIQTSADEAADLKAWGRACLRANTLLAAHTGDTRAVMLSDVKEAFDDASLARDEAGFLGTPAQCIRFLAEEVGRLSASPAHSPDKAVTREGVDLDRDAKRAFDAWMGKENAGGFDHVKPMWLRVAAALAPKPTGTEAGRGDATYYPTDLKGADLLGWIVGYYGTQMPMGLANKLFDLMNEWHDERAATPTPPVSPSPDSTGPAGAELHWRQVESTWRDAGLPEYFLGNGGSNDRLYTFARLIRALTPSEPIAYPSPDSTGQGDAQTQEGGQ